MILTDDENIANEIRRLRDYVTHATFKIRYNYKMIDIEAVQGLTS